MKKKEDGKKEERITNEEGRKQKIRKEVRRKNKEEGSGDTHGNKDVVEERGEKE